MPYGIKQGSRVEIAAQFFDVKGNIIVIPGGAGLLNIAYTSLSGLPALFSTPMLSAGFDLIGAWDSTPAAFGLAVISFVFGPVTVSPPDPVMRIMKNTGA